MKTNDDKKIERLRIQIGGAIIALTVTVISTVVTLLGIAQMA